MNCIVVAPAGRRKDRASSHVVETDFGFHVILRTE
jgi:hypothetical protein